MIDDNARIRSEDNILKVVRSVNAYRLAFNKRRAVDVTAMDIVAIPSRMRCVAAIKTQDGQTALKQVGITENNFFQTYQMLEPKILSGAYHILKSRPHLSTSDLPGRLAQTAFELNAMPTPVPSQQDKFLKLVGESSLEDFEKVRANVIDYAFFRLRLIAAKTEGGIIALSKSFEKDRSSGRFLNEVFKAVADPHAFEIMNAFEFSGYDLDDPSILRETVFEPCMPRAKTSPVETVRLG